MKAIFIWVTALIFPIAATNAQIPTFQMTFGYTNGVGQWLDGALDVAQLQDSSIFVLAFSQGLQAYRQPLVITKFTKEGDQTFENPYGADSTFYYAGHHATMIKTKDGNFAVAGSGGINLIDTWATLWIFSSAGDSLFEKDYGSLGEGDTLENFYDLVQLPDSGYMMVGWKELNPNIFPIPDINPNVYLVRTDKSGNLLWEQTYDKSFSDQGNHIEMFDGTHVIIAGSKHAYNSPNDTPWVFVTDFDGNIVKERSFTDPPYNCYAAIGPRIFKGVDQNFLFTGCLNGALQNGFFETPLYIAKMDTSLNFIWERDFNSANVIYIYHAEQMEDSSIMVVGYQQDSVNDRIWGWVSKLDNSGNVIWDKLYKQGSSFINYLYDIDQTYDCGFVVSGSNNNGDQQSWLLKMDRFGCINPVCDTMPGSCGTGIPTNNSQWQSVSTLELDVSLYPNPANDELNVFYNLPQDISTGQLLIFDVNGKKVFEQKLARASHSISVDVSEWMGGLYMCEIRTAGNQITKRLVVGR